MTNRPYVNGSSKTTGTAYPTRAGSAAGRLSIERFRPVRLLIFLIPVSFAIILSNLLDKNQGQFLTWWATLLLFGIAAFPLTCTLFSSFRGKCYGFAKAIGILSSSFVLWTLCYLEIVGFTRIWVSVFFAALAAISWGLPSTRKAAVTALSSKSDVIEITVQETLFIVALVIMCVLKGMRPEINGEEKFMDFAFLNTLVRTDTLPAPDPWLAGNPINYYYYGQYIYAFITKMTGMQTGIAYNLSMCTTFAFSFSMAYTLGSMFIDSAIRKGMMIPTFLRAAGGWLSAFAVAVFGNSHAFFYDEKSIGNRFLFFLRDLGIQVGKTNMFFYPDSTRYIGHNPDSRIQFGHELTGVIFKIGDYTIHEFPYYSYLLGDLHAHVVGLLIVMLIVGVLFSLYDKARPPSVQERLIHAFPDAIDFQFFYKRLIYELRHMLRPEVLIVGILLGIATMCNYWDFLIYFIVSSMVLLIYNTVTSRHFVTFAGIPFFLMELFMILAVYLKYSKSAYALVGLELAVFGICLVGVAILPNALTRTGAGMSFLFCCASLCSLTFSAHFDMIANSLAKTEDQSPVYQFLILWGVHLIFAFLLLFLTVFSRKDKLMLSRINLQSKMTRSIDDRIDTGEEDIPSNDLDKQKNRVAHFLSVRWPSDIFMSGIAVVAFLLLAAPEIFYVRDIYGGSYKRANTMFKFAFEAFVLLSLVMAYTFFRFLFVRRKKSTRSTVVVVCGAILLPLLLCIPMRYPIASTEQRTGNFGEAKYIGLDGTAYLLVRDSPQIIRTGPDLIEYAAGIDWLNQNVTGSPIICEANGCSYQDYCLVSAYTGLPTILGWQTHEWLWHFQGIVDKNGDLVSDPDKPDVWVDIMTPRQNDIRNIYTSTDAIAVRWLLDKYDVTYLIIGDLERTAFPDLDDALLQGLGTKVFEDGSFCIIQLK